MSAAAQQKVKTPEPTPARRAVVPEPRRAASRPARELGGNQTRVGPEPVPATRREPGAKAETRAEAKPGEGLQLEPKTPEPQEGGKAPGPASDATQAYLTAMETPPSRMALAWSAAGTQAAGTFVQQQRALDAALPTLTAKLDGAGTKAVETVKPEKPVPKAGAQVEIAAGERPAPLPAPAPTLAPPTTQNREASRKLAAETGQDPEALRRDGSKLIAGLSTTDEVEADPGPPPSVTLTEGADPARAASAEKETSESAEKARAAASDAIVKGPGPAQVQPAKLEVEHHVPPTTPGAMPGLDPVPGMDQVANWKLDPKAAAAFDNQAQPRMSEHLKQSKLELGKAETQRQADREAAVEDGKKKVAEANEQADRHQAQKVGEVRDQIVGEQKDTLKKQSEAVEGLNKDTASRKQEALNEIDGRVKTDEKKIGADFQQAKTDAQAEQRKSEDEARAEKEKAERESKEQSWWDRAVSFVTDLIDKIAKAIDSILSALKKVVGAILDKVKKAALALIDKARQWINEKLDQFGNWLKKAVTAVLGDLFPELTRKINAFIDRKIEQAKAAVNAVADGLKKTVSALIDGLKKALDKIIDGFRAAVKVAAALAKALVTGDWAEVAKMLLEGILSVLGIDPAEFYAFIAKIRNTLGKIVSAPGVFVGYLIDAVVLGFRQFTDKILDYLKAGVLQWLFGVVAESGITLPKKFDVAGVLDLVLQVLGLTKARLRDKAVKLIGEKNVERIEFVWQFISTAIEGGLSGLWEKIKEFLGGLWDMVVGAAQDWLVTTLVKKALVKLVSLFNPVGAIIQLILTAWDVYVWVRDNARRIAELVRAVVDSLGEIAAGAIAKAAGWIEGALAKLVPIAINLLANIMGLGGIGEKIKEIITGIQNTVDSAIDKLINKVLGLFKGVSEKKTQAGATAVTIGKTIPFSAAGLDHTLSVQMSGAQPTLMVASHPLAVPNLLADWTARTDRLPADKQSAAAQLIQQASAAHEQTRARLGAEASAASSPTTGTAPPAANASMHDQSVSAEQVLTDKLKGLFELFGDDPNNVASQRFEQAQNKPELNPPASAQVKIFHREDWEKAFKIEERQAQIDLKWGLEHGKVKRLGSGKSILYELHELTYLQLVSIAVTEFLRFGRNAPETNQLSFAVTQLSAFCEAPDRAERLPMDGLKFSANGHGLARLVGKELVNQGVLAADPKYDSFSWASSIPPRRHLPQTWNADSIRNKFYLNGASPSWDSAKTTVIQRDLGKITDAIRMQTKPEGSSEQAYGAQLWNGLQNRFIVPSGPFQWTTNYTKLDREVDHEIPLAQHWIDLNGNNSKWRVRQQLATDVDHLFYVLKEFNRSKSGGGFYYKDKWWVEPSFEGPGNETHAEPGVLYSLVPNRGN